MSTQNFATLQMVRNILDGTTIPARATSATNDGEGNNIPATYAKKGGKIIPAVWNNGYFAPENNYPSDVEINIDDIALVVRGGGSAWGSTYNTGDMFIITSLQGTGDRRFNVGTKIGNIFGTSGRYRVGDWVLSDNNASPASEYGGSWEQVENVFLYASGTNDVGATGGELTHTLTVEELPSQNQEVTDQDSGRKYGRGYGAGVPGYSISVTEVDNIGALMQTDFNSQNTPFSLMPPYRVTNFWRRVA